MALEVIGSGVLELINKKETFEREVSCAKIKEEVNEILVEWKNMQIKNSSVYWVCDIIANEINKFVEASHEVISKKLLKASDAKLLEEEEANKQKL